jgi:hypothetical protein
LQEFSPRSAKDWGEAGFLEGQNVAIEYRWAYNNHERLPALAAELVDLKVDLKIDVIVT